MYPEKLKYHSSHIWIKFVDKNTILVGLTEYVIKQMGKIFSIDTVKPKQKISQKENLITVLTPKGKVDFQSFLTGEILEVNNSVLEEPNILLTDCYSNWILKIKVTKLPQLMSCKKYKKFVNA